MFQKFKSSLGVLTNTLVCKGLSFLGILSYPQELLPKNSYGRLINFDEVLDKTKNVFLVRKSYKNFDYTFQDVGGEYFLREGVIKHSDIPPGLSLNLLGARFQIHHLKFRTLNSGNETWNGKSRISLSRHLRGYEIENKEYIPIFLHANKMHGQNIPYNKSKDKNSEAEITKFLGAINSVELKAGKYVLNGTSNILHAPTLLNYWHVEFTLLDFKQDKIEAKSASWIKEYCTQVMKDIVIANAYANLSSIDEISKDFYLKAV